MASTTTIASSTTIPIASTSPKSDRVFRLKPNAAIAANVPTMATGTAISGISGERQFWRKTMTTSATEDHRVAEGLEHLVDRFGDVGVVS